MKILALTNLYPRPGHEGFAPFNRQQFRALGRAHDLRVIAPVPWTEAVLDLRAGIPAPRGYVNADGLWVDHPRFFFPPRVLRRSYGSFYLASVRPAVDRLLKGFRPDVLLSSWAHPDGWAAVRIGRQAGVPVVIKVVGTDLVLAEDPARRRRIAEGLSQAAGVIAVSHELAERSVQLGADPARVHVVPEGLDAGLFHPGDRAEARARLGLNGEGRILLFVGHLLFSKGVGVLLEACELLARRGLAFHGYLVGHGRDEPALRARAARLGLDRLVTLVGPRPHAELPDWYRASDLVLLPSFSEGLPNVLREAVACGRPFVATRVGGIPEIADPSYSRLVPPRSAGELGDAIEEMLADAPGAEAAAARVRQASCEESARLLAERLQAAAATAVSRTGPLTIVGQ
jgi:glycosyltransferase involved in cell wall biosynthesis